MTRRELDAESIRGAWFSRRATAQVLRTFGFAQDFARYELRAPPARTKELELGGYTFDGEFLIVRGRSTETYRVEAPRPDRWSLRAKKDELALWRAPENDDGASWSDALARSLRILPLRAKLAWIIEEARVRVAELRLASDSGELGPRLGFASVEEHAPRGTLWIGIAPTVRCEDAVWERIARESIPLQLEARAESWAQIEFARLDDPGR